MPKNLASLLDKKKKKKPKQKQKQKQKQIVKTNVKVNVQSQGGSGGGGTPSFVPQTFRDTSGENIRLTNLLEQALRPQAAGRVASVAPIAAPIAAQISPTPIRVKKPIYLAPEPVAVSNDIRVRKPIRIISEYDPSNDEATVSSVFNAPINLKEPIQLGLGAEEKPKRKYTKKPKIIAEAVGNQEPIGAEVYNPSNYEQTVSSVFNAPIDYNVPFQLGPIIEQPVSVKERIKQIDFSSELASELAKQRLKKQAEEKSSSASSIGMARPTRPAPPTPVSTQKVGGASKQPKSSDEEILAQMAADKARFEQMKAAELAPRFVSPTTGEASPFIGGGSAGTGNWIGPDIFVNADY